MTLPDLVVCGFDDSPQSLTAARWAADWCTRLHMRLRLLAVSGTVGTASRDISRGRPAEPADQQAELSAQLEQVRAHLTESYPTLSIDSVVLGGLPADQLIEASRAGALLVLGTRGLGPALSSLLGGVAEDVVTRAPGPVVVVPSTLTRAREHVITLGIDPQGPSFEATRFALEVAERMVAGLRVVACVEAGESPDRAAMMHDDSLATAIGDHFDLPIDQRVVRGRSHEVLAEAAAGTELLVVGSRGRSGLTGLLLGSTSRRVVREASVPTVVVKPGQEQGSSAPLCGVEGIGPTRSQGGTVTGATLSELRAQLVDGNDPTLVSCSTRPT